MATRRIEMLLLLAGSFLFQTIQLGLFPILVAQILSVQTVETSVIGLVLSALWIAVFAFGPFVPKLINRLGSGMANGLGLGASLLALGIVAVSHSLTAIVIASMLMGTGLIIRWVVCDTLVVGFSAEKHRGRWIGFHEALMGLGIALGPLFFAVLTLQQVIGAGFVVGLFGTTFFAGLWLLEGYQIDVGGERSDPSAMAPSLVRLIKCAPFFLVALFAAFFAGFIESAAVALFPLSFEAAGLSLPTAVILVSAFGFGGTVLQPPLGWAADKFGHIQMQFVCVFIVITTCVLAAVGTTGLPYLWVIIFLMGAAAGGFNTLAVIQTAQLLQAERLPLAMTAIAMLYTTGSIVGPVAAGFSLEALPASGLYWVFGASGIVLGAGLIWYRLQTRY